MEDRALSRSPRLEAPLRLLYLQPCAAFGGAERQASIVIPDLLRAGITVIPLVGPAQTMVRWLHEQGVTEVLHTEAFPGRWSSPRPIDQLARLPAYLRCARAVGQEVDHLIEARAIDVVLAVMPFSWLAATEVARRRRVPIVWRAGGTLIQPVQKAVLRAWARFHPPDLLFCCSEAVRATIGPYVPAPAVVIDNGVDLQRFRPDGARHRPPGSALVVGCAARMAPEKRPEDFIEMAARLAPLHPEVVFLMAGDGNRRGHCEALIRARRLEGRLHMLGYVEDMRAFYAACDLLTLPSRSEGLSNTMLEAMSMGTPLAVSSEVAETSGLVPEKEGLVFPVGDLDAYCICVTRMLESTALRAALQMRARHRVQRDFDARHSAIKIAAMLRGLIAMSLKA